MAKKVLNKLNISGINTNTHNEHYNVNVFDKRVGWKKIAETHDASLTSKLVIECSQRHQKVAVTTIDNKLVMVHPAELINELAPGFSSIHR